MPAFLKTWWSRRKPWQKVVIGVFGLSVVVGPFLDDGSTTGSDTTQANVAGFADVTTEAEVVTTTTPSETATEPPATTAVPSTSEPRATTAAPDTTEPAATATTAVASSPASADVVIARLNYDADGNDNQNKNGEWVDISNDGSEAADLTGWSITDENVNHTFQFSNGFTLEPGATVRVFSGCGTASDTELYWCNSGSAIWNNDGDTATLSDAAGDVVDVRSY